MQTKKLTALALADTMLATDASLANLIAACHRVFNAVQPWAPTLCIALLERTGANFHYFNRYELTDLLLHFLGHNIDDTALAADALAPTRIVLPPLRRYCVEPPLRPAPEPWLAALALPQLHSVGALAGWLEEPAAALEWFADRWRPTPQPRLQHYLYRWLPKRSGGVRLIEIPKQRLRRLQQTILRGILDRVPPHPAAHGFRRAHSCVTHAAQHAGQAAVLRLDLKDFFPSIQYARVHALFEKLGYPANVAGLLARICVNRTPRAVLREQPALSRLERQGWTTPHLPQGSPCSPALANLCAYRLDLRLAALAQSLGGHYSRYADDLAFSGGAGLARSAPQLQLQIAAIALEEGFMVNPHKTRLMRAGSRQQLTGVVVNAHPNLARDDYDRLKATLTNCVRHGPASQNRERHPDFRAHLAGKVSHLHMLNPARAGKLQRLLDSINWNR